MYQVRVGRFPHCSCPDFAKGNICKHYLYVMLRVLRLRQDDPLVWQKALLLSEAEEVSTFRTACTAPSPACGQDLSGRSHHTIVPRVAQDVEHS